jgi:FkbM family methyltransferase
MDENSVSQTHREFHQNKSLRLIDVGGAGGLQQKWLKHADKIIPILFEPNPTQAATLRATTSQDFDETVVVESALSNVIGTRNINIARYWGCTSLREPNPDILSKYRISPAFNITHTETISCTRYDKLFYNGEVPAPDMIKIDVQGFEYEVLQGFGGLLQNCLAIELETHLYPIYKDQKLLHDMVSFLADFGFVLRRLNPVPSFDGNVVELDAWFTKDIEAWRTFDTFQKRKFGLICEVCELIDYRRIDQNASHNHIDPL